MSALPMALPVFCRRFSTCRGQGSGQVRSGQSGGGGGGGELIAGQATVGAGRGVPGGEGGGRLVNDAFTGQYRAGSSGAVHDTKCTHIAGITLLVS